MLYKNIFQGKGKPSMQVATEQDQEVMGKRCQENRVWYCIASFGFCGVFLRLSAFTVGAVNLISMDRFNSSLDQLKAIINGTQNELNLTEYPIEEIFAPLIEETPVLIDFAVAFLVFFSGNLFFCILVDPNNYDWVKRLGVLNMVILSGEQKDFMHGLFKNILI